MSLQTDAPWYVAQTKVRQEQVASDNLARQGYAVYLPRIRTLKRLRQRQQTQFDPMFPRYMFFQPSSADHSIAPVRSTQGVTTIVRFGQDPAVLKLEILNGIRDFEARRNRSTDQEISPFQPGGRVLFAEGPLTGMEGLISDATNERVIVLMQLLGQNTRVSVSHHQLLVAR
ncbi:MAG: transcriptional activator RfaH [Sulfuritalea sp.]|nr:transcriptional activator RfaH [Sulfuritalea sp.]MCF8184245.1 transcriptional activator RfaH [Polynucleobacter sp.]